MMSASLRTVEIPQICTARLSLVDHDGAHGGGLARSARRGLHRRREARLDDFRKRLLIRRHRGICSGFSIWRVLNDVCLPHPLPTLDPTHRRGEDRGIAPASRGSRPLRARISLIHRQAGQRRRSRTSSGSAAFRHAGHISARALGRRRARPRGGAQVTWDTIRASYLAPPTALTALIRATASGRAEREALCPPS